MFYHTEEYDSVDPEDHHAILLTDVNHDTLISDVLEGVGMRSHLGKKTKAHDNEAPGEIYCVLSPARYLHVLFALGTRMVWLVAFHRE